MFLVREALDKDFKVGDIQALIEQLMGYRALVTKDSRERKEIYDKLGIEYNESFFDNVETNKKYKKMIQRKRGLINKSVGDIGNGRKGFLVVGESVEARKHTQKHIENEHICRVIDTTNEIMQMVKEGYDGWDKLIFTDELDIKKVLDKIYENSAVIPVCENRDRKDGIKENTELEFRREEVRHSFTNKDGEVDWISFNKWVRGELSIDDTPAQLRDMGLMSSMDLYALNGIEIWYPTGEEMDEMRRNPNKTYHIDLTQKYVEPYIDKKYTPTELKRTQNRWSKMVELKKISKKNKSPKSKVSDRFFGYSEPSRL